MNLNQSKWAAWPNDHWAALTVATLLVVGFASAAPYGPSLYDATKSGTSFSFAFQAASGAQYDVEYREDPYVGAWRSLRNVSAGPSREVTIADTGAIAPSRFYRVSGSDALYSENAVGYINIRFTPLTNLFANHLSQDTNRLTWLIREAPERTTVWKPGPFGTECAEFYEGEWHDCATGLESEMTLPPGQGAVLITDTTFTVTFVGSVIEGTTANQMPAGLSLCSSIVPQAGTISSQLGFTARFGDAVYKFDSEAETYRKYTFEDIGWTPFEPTLQVGEPVWFDLVAATTWVRDFSVTPWTGGYYSVTNYEYRGMAGPVLPRQPPVIVSNPRSQVAEPGSDVTLKVEVSGSARVWYRWRCGSNEVAHGTSPSLTLVDVQEAERGDYSCMVSNAFGCVTSAVARVAVELRPTLQLKRIGNDVTVCWPDSATPYVLEESENPSGEWIDATAVRTLQNGTQCITAPVLPSARFYRLRAHIQD